MSLAPRNAGALVCRVRGRCTREYFEINSSRLRRLGLGRDPTGAGTVAEQTCGQRPRTAPVAEVPARARGGGDCGSARESAEGSAAAHARQRAPRSERGGAQDVRRCSRNRACCYSRRAKRLLHQQAVLLADFCIKLLTGAPCPAVQRPTEHRPPFHSDCTNDPLRSASLDATRKRPPSPQLYAAPPARPLARTHDRAAPPARPRRAAREEGHRRSRSAARARAPIGRPHAEAAEGPCEQLSGRRRAW